jgi:FKBP-type peptidyl-prolyl cis-trans isomerase
MHIWALVVCLLLAFGACKKESKSAADAAPESTTEKPPIANTATTTTPARPQVPPPPDVAKAPADAQKTASGVLYKVITPGKDGATVVGKNDLVTIHFTVWSPSGETKHSTTLRNRPDKFPLGAIPMRDLAEGTIGMKVGERRRLWAPPEVAYAMPNGKAEALTYEVEVIETKSIVADPTELTAPADATAGPADTKYKIITKGKGKKPTVDAQIKVRLSEWSPDGRLRRSTALRGNEPAQMQVKNLPPGLKENIESMAAGERRYIWSPPRKDAAPENAGQKEEDSARLYDVELVEIVKTVPPPPAPKDVAKPPKDAKKTEAGVFYKVLKAGSGPSPTANSDVTVHYTGWTTDGKMFDSSVTRGAPATFNLDRVIPGWKDGLQTMKVGGKSRFWIPEELAYKGRPGPQGMLVFDVELKELPKTPAPE